jgi:hypothetical protein
MKKIISYSLWGDLPLYTVGAISNAKQAKEIYPGWICRFYLHEPSVPQWVVEELKKQDNVEIVFYNDEIGWGGMLYRFYPATEDDVEVMLSRDTDSRLSAREKACVDQWLNTTDKNLHVIRDACVHQSQMMGGLWGTRRGYLKWIKPHIDHHLEMMRDGSAIKGCDQKFLNEIVYTYAVGLFDNTGKPIENKLSGFDPNQISILSHDDIAFGCKRFPNFARKPSEGEVMYKLPIPRKYGKEYKACQSCGLHHDSEFIGRDECLTDEECKYINLTPEQIEERNNIVKYYKLYQKDRDILGLTTIYE